MSLKAKENYTKTNFKYLAEKCYWEFLEFVLSNFRIGADRKKNPIHVQNLILVVVFVNQHDRCFGDLMFGG